VTASRATIRAGHEGSGWTVRWACDGSPDSLDGVRAEATVGSNQRAALDRGLSDEQAVEGVAMVPWQSLDCRGVDGGNRHWIEPEALQRCRPFVREPHLPQRTLDRDFPYASGTERNVVCGVLERLDDGTRDPVPIAQE
jgi:hypothetical protein